MRSCSNINLKIRIFHLPCFIVAPLRLSERHLSHDSKKPAAFPIAAANQSDIHNIDNTITVHI